MNHLRVPVTCPDSLLYETVAVPTSLALLVLYCFGGADCRSSALQGSASRRFNLIPDTRYAFARFQCTLHSFSNLTQLEPSSLQSTEQGVKRCNPDPLRGPRLTPAKTILFVELWLRRDRKARRDVLHHRASDRVRGLGIKSMARTTKPSHPFAIPSDIFIIIIHSVRL